MNEYFEVQGTELAAAALYRINDLKTGRKTPAPVLERVLLGPVKNTAVTATEIFGGYFLALVIGVLLALVG
ncbi:MAG: hypothetical protein HC938_12055 [Nitrospira sp.]|nr:hypothetical protein [Nitrospira sp.]